MRDFAIGIRSSLAVGALVPLLTACGGSGAATTGGGGQGTGSGAGAGGLGAGGGVSSEGDGDHTISPPYMPDPDVLPSDKVPHGTVSAFTMSSTKSAIFPTDVVTGQPFTRDAAVYVPHQYVSGTEAPFMVVQDGVSLYEKTMVPTLDNLIAARQLPPLIVIFVQPGPAEGTPDGERSFEYDTVSDDWVTFVEAELLPKVEKDYHVKLTQDPDGRGTMGGSSGGTAAFTMGWFRPDAYHRIVTYSGSFTDLQPTPAYPHGAWEYHDSLIQSTPAKPLRVALEVGGNDLDWNTATDHMRRWITANRAMAKALTAKGYHQRFVYAEGAKHVDPSVLQQTLPDTLRWVWQGYPIP